MKDLRRPSVHCPVCGAYLPIGSLRAHVAGDRCDRRFAKAGGVFHCPVRGRVAADLARALEEALRVSQTKA